MSNFTPLVEKTHMFEGDEIRVKFSRLKRKHILKVLPMIQAMERETDEEKSDELQRDLLDVLLGILPEHVKEFTGLKDKDGNPVSFDVVADDTYFLNLTTDIGMELIAESLPMLGKKGKNG